MGRAVNDVGCGARLAPVAVAADLEVATRWGIQPAMTSLRCFAIALITLAACEKPKATETPTTQSPDGATTTPDATAGDATAGAGECKPTGCSGIVCSDEEVMTTCEYRPEYACYKTATCARQDDGACGWTKSAELDACLANPPQE